MLIIAIVVLFFIASFLIVAALYRSLLVQLVKFEGVAILLADVLARRQTVQVEYQVQHLFVALLVVERDDRNAVVDLVRERVHRVIYNHHVFHAAVGDDSQVLYVVALRGLHAVLSIHAVLEKLVLGIDVIENGVGVDLVRGCEYDHLEHLVGLLQALH